MRNIKNILVLLVIFAMVLPSYFSRVCMAADRNGAQQALINAENATVSAYLAVTEAQKAGANVSELISKLEVGADWLAKANNAFRLGDYDNAYDFAANCVKAIEGVAYEAKVLMEEAQRSRWERLFLSAAYSSVGLSLLFVFSLFGWKYLKRFYVRRIFKMKPEVIGENER